MASLIASTRAVHSDTGFSVRSQPATRYRLFGPRAIRCFMAFPVAKDCRALVAAASSFAEPGAKKETGPRLPESFTIVLVCLAAASSSASIFAKGSGASCSRCSDSFDAMTGAESSERRPEMHA